MGNLFSADPMNKTELKSGHKVVPITDDELKEKLAKDFTPMDYGVIRLEPGGWFFYKSFPKYADRIYDFKFKPSDVLVMTYPKCGTTWTQEIVWTMLNNIDLNHPEAHISIMLRSPFIDSDFFMDVPLPGMFSLKNPFFLHFLKKCPGRNPFNGMMLQLAERISEPRTLKTHLPFSLFEPGLIDKCKVIYVVRNPLDVCVSYYHHNRLMKPHGFVGTWDSFIDHFINDTVIFNPYWQHVREAWQKRNHPNLLFCFYEEMKADPRKNIERINEFIGRNLTHEEIDKVVKYTSFRAMKERDVALGQPDEVFFMFEKDVHDQDGGFFRKGESGDWRSKFNKEQKEKMAKSIRKNLEDGFDENFPYWKTLKELEEDL